MHQAQLIDPIRAARLAGVTHDVIQQLVADGVLPIQHGKIDLSDLRRLYPDIEARRTTMVEVAAQIREDAFAKAMHRDDPPNVESLKVELRQARQEIAYFRAEVGRCKALASDMERLLVDYQHQSQDKQRVEAMIAWLRLQTKFLQRYA